MSNNLRSAAERFGNRLDCLDISVDLRAGAVSWRGQRVIVPKGASEAKCRSVLKHFVRGAEWRAERNHAGELFEQMKITDAIKPSGKQIIITAITPI
ncbi:MAG: hypothetical protein ACK5MU_04105 [Candidatus Saccharimonadales bacterium]